MPYIIAIDLGTTHCKAVVVTHKGEAIKTFKADVESLQPQPGWHEQDAEKIFQSVLNLLRQCFQLAGAEEILCVSFSAAMHSLLAVDENGTPLTNAITWADTRSKKYAQQLRTSAEGFSIYENTGTPIHAMSPLCKLLWLRHEAPEIFSKAYKFISIKEYIFYKLFGKYIVDEGIASSTGLLNVTTKQWYQPALSLANIHEQLLSQVVNATHTEKELLPEIETLLNTLANIPFVIGGNDGALANLGCGAMQKQNAALTIGTSGAARILVQQPLPLKEMKLFQYCLADEWYVTGGPVNNGGIVLQWFAENFLNMPLQTPGNFNRMMQLAAEAPPGSSDLFFIPYLLGERAPVWDEDACGIFYGLRMQHKPSHLTRAVIEGISFSLMQILQDIENVYGTVQNIHASGIIVQSDWWMQLLSDMNGKKIIASKGADASAMGAAYIGMYAMGIIKNLRQAASFTETEKSFSPNHEAHDVYKKHFQKFIRIYPATKNIS